jgi:hypothetical protein
MTQSLRLQVSFLKNARNGTEPRFIGVSTKEGLMDASLLHPAKEAGRNFRLQDIRMKDFLLHDQVCTFHHGNIYFFNFIDNNFLYFVNYVCGPRPSPRASTTTTAGRWLGGPEVALCSTQPPLLMYTN